MNVSSDFKLAFRLATIRIEHREIIQEKRTSREMTSHLSNFLWEISLTTKDSYNLRRN